ncbi:DNA translocase FtsK [Candidatus Microgenomates bacterium]|nr:DNA translocase FtsK [Candidatus Microgenomates bacterium]
MARRKLTIRHFRLHIKKQTVYSIAQISFFIIAALIILSFSRSGAWLAGLNDLLFFLFSWTALLLPFLFIVAGFMFSKLRTPLNSPNVFVGSLLFFICLTALTGAGFFGNKSFQGIAVLITAPGSFLLFLAGVIVGLLVLFNTSLDQVITIVGRIFNFLWGHIVGRRPALGARSGLRVSGEQTRPQPTPQKGQELTEELVTNIPGQNRVWQYPPLTLLSDTLGGKAERGDIKQHAAIIERTLESFGITARVVEVNLGPAVTQYALEVGLGTKLSKITALDRDLALALAAPTGQIRIEAPIPGRSLVGIELPNRSPEFVPLKRILESDEMRKSKSKLMLAMGLDVSGTPVVADLAKMPHMLIAGQTGSGKSVAINSFLCSLLFRSSPEEVKFILVDPKRVELTGYTGIPHLLSPVIVDPEKVLSALKWALSEMDRRYKLFAQVGARNIESFNELSGFQALPYIMIFIDELADIMLFAPVEVEDAITRIAQMSRATGIHMVIATQRPSVDIITGLIKANIPARVAFAVASQVDSRVVLDVPGAEKLLGRGDMLFIPPDQAKPTRIQGTYVADSEINRIIDFLKHSGVAPQYTEEVVTMPTKGGRMGLAGGSFNEKDDLFDEAVRIICQYDRASASLLQRRLSIGYARAARILDQLEGAGVVGPADGAKPREVLVKNAEEFLASVSQTQS